MARDGQLRQKERDSEDALEQQDFLGTQDRLPICQDATP